MLKNVTTKLLSVPKHSELRMLEFVPPSHRILSIYSTSPASNHLALKEYIVMLISDIDILPVRPNKGLVGFASFVIDNWLCINNVAIHASPDGMSLRLVYPCKVLPNGKQIQSAFPINKEKSLLITSAVAEAYKKVAAKSGY